MTTTRQSLIPILVYSDIAAAHDFLVERFGFDSGGLHRDDEGQVDHGEVSLQGQVIWLHRVLPEFGLTSPKTHGASTGMLAVVVDDVEATTPAWNTRTPPSSPAPPTSRTDSANTAPTAPKVSSGPS